jgi:two-component system, NarL family, response regulator NreC
MQILIVDDNEMVRRGVSALISSRPTWQVCGYAGDGKEALRKAKELRPDIILLDISMPGTNGLDVARILRREMPKTKIVIMSQHDPIQVLPRVLEAGAHACVDKNSLNTDLLPTIETLGKTIDARRGSNAS